MISFYKLFERLKKRLCRVSARFVACMLVSRHTAMINNKTAVHQVLHALSACLALYCASNSMDKRADIAASSTAT